MREKLLSISDKLVFGRLGMVMMMGGWDLKDLRDVGKCGVRILRARDMWGRERKDGIRCMHL